MSSNVDPVNWGLTGVAAGLSFGRFIVRRYSLNGWYWDDLVHLLALLVLIAHGVTSQVTDDAKDQLKAMVAAAPHLSDAQMLEEYKHVASLNAVNNCFLHLVFWLVKVAFLMFYRMLFKSSKNFRRAWWAVLVFTLLTFWIPIAGVLATCGGASTLQDYKSCTGDNSSRTTKLIYSCVVNVVTDVAIMILPLWMLKDLKIKLTQKLGLGFLFSFATFCIALDILRTAQAVAQNQALYTVLEINFVVMVSCMPTYHTLFTLRRRLQERSSEHFGRGGSYSYGNSSGSGRNYGRGSRNDSSGGGGALGKGSPSKHPLASRATKPGTSNVLPWERSVPMTQYANSNGNGNRNINDASVVHAVRPLHPDDTSTEDEVYAMDVERSATPTPPTPPAPSRYRERERDGLERNSSLGHIHVTRGFEVGETRL